MALLCATVTPASADDAVSRGKYLTILGDCAGCHSTPHGQPFTGGLPFSAAFGTVYSTNITPDKATGLGNWTEADFTWALHEGVAPGGKRLYPAFPYAYFTHVSASDTHALWLYLKSLKPAYAPPHPNALLFPFNIRAVLMVWNWLFLDKTSFQPERSKSADWNRGAYLVTGLGHCAACHTPKNIMFGDEVGKALTGAVVGGWFSANLTGGDHDGLGKWSHADLVRYLATGRNQYATAAGSMQEKVTSSTSRMADADRASIATYLKSLPPNPQVMYQKPDAAQMQRGAALFVANCTICHQPVVDPNQLPQGGLADYPELVGDTLVMGHDATTVTRIVLEGAQSAVTANEHTGYSMPSFAALPDRDVADLVTYIRNAWGNNAPSVSAGEVKRLRASIASEPN